MRNFMKDEKIKQTLFISTNTLLFSESKLVFIKSEPFTIYLRPFEHHCFDSKIYLQYNLNQEILVFESPLKKGQKILKTKNQFLGCNFDRLILLNKERKEIEFFDLKTKKLIKTEKLEKNLKAFIFYESYFVVYSANRIEFINFNKKNFKKSFKILRKNVDDSKSSMEKKFIDLGNGDVKNFYYSSNIPGDSKSSMEKEFIDLGNGDVNNFYYSSNIPGDSKSHMEKKFIDLGNGDVKNFYYNSNIPGDSKSSMEKKFIDLGNGDVNNFYYSENNLQDNSKNNQYVSNEELQKYNKYFSREEKLINKNLASSHKFNRHNEISDECTDFDIKINEENIVLDRDTYMNKHEYNLIDNNERTHENYNDKGEFGTSIQGQFTRSHAQNKFEACANNKLDITLDSKRNDVVNTDDVSSFFMNKDSGFIHSEFSLLIIEDLYFYSNIYLGYKINLPSKFYQKIILLFSETEKRMFFKNFSISKDFLLSFEPIILKEETLCKFEIFIEKILIEKESFNDFDKINNFFDLLKMKSLKLKNLLTKENKYKFSKSLIKGLKEMIFISKGIKLIKIENGEFKSYFTDDKLMNSFNYISLPYKIIFYNIFIKKNGSENNKNFRLILNDLENKIFVNELINEIDNEEDGYDKDYSKVLMMQKIKNLKTKNNNQKIDDHESNDHKINEYIIKDKDTKQVKDLRSSPYKINEHGIEDKNTRQEKDIESNSYKMNQHNIKDKVAKQVKDLGSYAHKIDEYVIEDKDTRQVKDLRSYAHKIDEYVIEDKDKRQVKDTKNSSSKMNHHNNKDKDTRQRKNIKIHDHESKQKNSLKIANYKHKSNDYNRKNIGYEIKNESIFKTENYKNDEFSIKENKIRKMIANDFLLKSNVESSLENDPFTEEYTDKSFTKKPMNNDFDLYKYLRKPFDDSKISFHEFKNKNNVFFDDKRLMEVDKLLNIFETPVKQQNSYDFESKLDHVFRNKIFANLGAGFYNFMSQKENSIHRYQIYKFQNKDNMQNFIGTEKYANLFLHINTVLTGRFIINNNPNDDAFKSVLNVEQLSSMDGENKEILTKEYTVENAFINDCNCKNGNSIGIMFGQSLINKMNYEPCENILQNENTWVQYICYLSNAIKYKGSKDENLTRFYTSVLLNRPSFHQLLGSISGLGLLYYKTNDNFILKQLINEIKNKGHFVNGENKSNKTNYTDTFRIYSSIFASLIRNNDLRYIETGNSLSDLFLNGLSLIRSGASFLAFNFDRDDDCNYTELYYSSLFKELINMKTKVSDIIKKIKIENIQNMSNHQLYKMAGLIHYCGYKIMQNEFNYKNENESGITEQVHNKDTETFVRSSNLENNTPIVFHNNEKDYSIHKNDSFRLKSKNYDLNYEKNDAGKIQYKNESENNIYNQKIKYKDYDCQSDNNVIAANQQKGTSIAENYKCTYDHYYELKKLMLNIEDMVLEDSKYKIIFDSLLICLSISLNGRCDMDLIRILRRILKKTERLMYLNEIEDFIPTGKKDEKQFGLRYGDIMLYKICLGIACTGKGQYEFKFNNEMIINSIITFYIDFSMSPEDENYFNTIRYLLITNATNKQEPQTNPHNIDLTDSEIDLWFMKEYKKLNEIYKKYTLDVLSDYFEKNENLTNLNAFKKIICNNILSKK